MMDQELIKMVRPKEIQDLVPWKVGTLTDRWVIISIASLESDDILFLRPPDKFEFTKRRPKDLIKIPTLGDVGRLLKGKSPMYMEQRIEGAIYYQATVPDITVEWFKADTELKARIKLFMWLAHGKTWDGEWKGGGDDINT